MLITHNHLKMGCLWGILCGGISYMLNPTDYYMHLKGFEGLGFTVPQPATSIGMVVFGIVCGVAMLVVKPTETSAQPPSEEPVKDVDSANS